MTSDNGIQVLSLGMSRTGTASMKEALRMLGHERVHHAYELYTHPEQSSLWLQAWNDKIHGRVWDRKQWDALLGDYTAVTDMPAVCFAKELIDIYPDAKIILVERDEQSWYNSFKTGVIDTYFDNAPATGIISLVEPTLLRPVHKLWTRLFASADGYFRSTTRKQMQENALPVYREHNAFILALAPQNRLLRFSLKDGWAPLCEFLSKPVPQVPFPNVNEGDAVKDVLAKFVAKSMRRAGFNLGVSVLVLAAVTVTVMRSGLASSYLG